MTRQQFIEKIKQLSIAERIALIETISRSLREDLETGQDAASVSTSNNAKCPAKANASVKSPPSGVCGASLNLMASRLRTKS